MSKHQIILDSIIDYTKEHGYPPTIAEIGDIVGFSSKNSTWNHLQKMFDAGMIETDNMGSPRAIRVPGYAFTKI